jgi:hypothetical protein
MTSWKPEPDDYLAIAIMALIGLAIWGLYRVFL